MHARTRSSLSWCHLRFEVCVCSMMAVVLLFVSLFTIEVIYANAIGNWVGTDDESPFKGLYEAEDKVAILTPGNFVDNVHNSESAWLVQFYNSWCGHCIKFAPLYKELAANIYNWRDVITLGSIDCAPEENTPLCREYEVMGYPTLRYFKPHTTNATVGEKFQRTHDNVTVLRQAIIVMLESTKQATPPEHWPHLQLIKEENIDSLVKDANKSEMLMVVEDELSFLGRELIMDLNSISWLTTRRILRTDYRGSPVSNGILRVHKDRSTAVVPLTKLTRLQAVQAVRTALAEYAMPNVLENNGVNKKQRVQVKQSFNQLVLVNRLHRIDIESALQFSLGHEIVLQPNISGPAFDALVAYLRAIRKYFPFEKSHALFLPRLTTDLDRRQSITGTEFKTLLHQYGAAFLEKPRKWFGCRGSVDMYRGYPCGMWMLFHTLTVLEYNQRATNPEVLTAVAGYIQNFFGCEECAEHFVEMSRTIAGNVTTAEDSVMWLWRAHNNVNRRLAGDASEDPAFPKVQFPVAMMCPNCRRTDGMDSRSQVLAYLVSMYSDVRPSVWETVNPVTQGPGQKVERSYWNFSLTDVNTCIGLYVLSACLLTVYTVRLFMKRHPRSRHHKYDFSFKA